MFFRLMVELADGEDNFAYKLEQVPQMKYDCCSRVAQSADTLRHCVCGTSSLGVCFCTVASSSSCNTWWCNPSWRSQHLFWSSRDTTMRGTSLLVSSHSLP